MPHYLLDTRQLWGDYGESLINASSSRRVWGTRPLQISRIGPYVPPLFRSGTNFLVVNDVKRRMEAEHPFPVTFRPTFYEHVHRLDWHKWDTSADAPARYPAGGEPEDYYWQSMPPRWWPRWARRLSSSSIARKMPRAWEMVPPVKECTVKRLDLDGPERFGHTHAITFEQGEHGGLFYSERQCLYVVADAAAREWLKGVLGEWVHFWPLLRRDAGGGDPYC
jgi:hypothetical protein